MLQHVSGNTYSPVGIGTVVACSDTCMLIFQLYLSLAFYTKAMSNNREAEGHF